MEDPGLPWSTVCLDFIGHLHGVEERLRNVLVMFDVHSKWLIVRFMSDVTTRKTTEQLKVVFQEEGLPPRILITDNGTQLVSHEMRNFLEKCSIIHHRTALCNLQAMAWWNLLIAWFRAPSPWPSRVGRV